MLFFKTFKIKETNRIISSFVIGVIYATSDEIHQSFIPGRGPAVTDVILDSIGILFGILIVILAVKIYKKIRFKYKEEKIL